MASERKDSRSRSQDNSRGGCMYRVVVNKMSEEEEEEEEETNEVKSDLLSEIDKNGSILIMPLA